jgi:hypothetical protein
VASRGLDPGSAHELIRSTLQALGDEATAEKTRTLVDAAYQFIREQAAVVGKDEFEITAITIKRARQGAHAQTVFRYAAAEDQANEPGTGDDGDDDGDEIPPGSWPFPWSGRICWWQCQFFECHQVCLVWWFP